MSEPIAGNPMADDELDKQIANIKAGREYTVHDTDFDLVRLLVARIDGLAARISRPSITADAVAGWKLVPVEPTDEMRDAAVKGSRADVSYADVEELWPAMLAAAPAHPAEKAGDPEPHAWAQWARVTYKGGRRLRQELLTAKLPFMVNENNDQIKIELLGEPQALYTRPLEGAGDPEPRARTADGLEPVAYQWRYSYHEGKWGEWCNEPRFTPCLAEEKRALYAHPAPDGPAPAVSEAEVEAAKAALWLPLRHGENWDDAIRSMLEAAQRARK